VRIKAPSSRDRSRISSIPMVLESTLVALATIRSPAKWDLDLGDVEVNWNWKLRRWFGEVTYSWAPWKGP
jgi:hypothetical protein